MKKHLFALFSTLFLIFLTSCSALLDNYSSVSVQLPDGLSKQLNFSREEYQQEPVTGGNTNPDNPVEHSYSFVSCTLEVIGDYQTSITNTYDSIDDINGSTISVSNIPVNSKVEVLLTLKCIRDGVPIGGFYGKSKAVTIAKGNNYVDLTLKPATTIDLGLDTDLVIEIYANGRRYTNEIPYADVYEIKLRKGMRYLPSNGQYTWKINNIDLFERVSNNGNNTFILYQQSIDEVFDDYAKPETYILSCYVLENSGTPQDSAYIEFKLVNYPDTLIWNYEGGYRYKTVRLDDLLNNRVSKDSSNWSETIYYFPDLVISKNGVFYKDNGYMKYTSKSGIKTLCESVYPHSFDFDSNSIYYESDGSFYRYSMINPFDDDIEIELPEELKDYQTYDIELITDKYIIDFESDNRTLLSSVYTNSGAGYENDLDFEEFMLNDTYDILNGMSLEDKMLIKDTLYLLYHRGTSDGNTYYQQGALVSLNLKTKNMKIAGYSDSETEYSGDNANITVVGLQENNKTAFFEPIRFVAIKDDELYIADHGRIFESKKESGSGKMKGCSRIVGVDLKTFAINTVTTLDNLKLAELSSVTGFNAE